MATFAELRTAIKTVLADALDDVHLYDTVPETANLPAIVVQPSEATFPVHDGRALKTSGSSTWL
jgi:hypothetical protein